MLDTKMGNYFYSLINVQRILINNIELFVSLTKFVAEMMTKPIKMQKKQCGGVYFYAYSIEF